MSNSNVKYLVSGWLVVPQLDGTELYKPFKRIISNALEAKFYINLMEHRNDSCIHTKVDSIECL